MSEISVGIIFKHRFQPAKQEAEKLKKWLSDRGVAAFSLEMNAKGVVTGCAEEADMVVPEGAGFFVVLGGDGTMLGAARQVALSTASTSRSHGHCCGWDPCLGCR